MGTFLLYNFQKQSTLADADARWHEIPELQQKDGAWIHSVVHCKVLIRAIMNEEELEKNHNIVNFLLIPSENGSYDELGKEPHVIHQEQPNSWKACLWLPECLVPHLGLTQSFVEWNEYRSFLDADTEGKVCSGLRLCNDTLRNVKKLGNSAKQKFAKAQSHFEPRVQSVGVHSAVRCNDVKQTLQSFLTSCEYPFKR